MWHAALATQLEPVAVAVAVPVVEAEVGGYTQLTLLLPRTPPPPSRRTLATLSYIVADHTKCVAGKRLLPCSCPGAVAVKGGNNEKRKRGGGGGES